MIIVGAPVHQRGWILRQWFDGLAKQSIGAQNIQVLLNYGDSTDDTLSVINEARKSGVFAALSTLVDKAVDHRPDRHWNEERYATMVRLRNDLLAEVRRLQPDYYLSCDTDMLLPPDALEILVEEIQAGSWGAIGPLAHMTPTGTCPNAFGLDGNRWLMSGNTEKVFAVFGVVLMAPMIYNVIDYSVHRQGEDVGWAADAWRASLPMAIAPCVKVKHVMNPGMLDSIDPRIGF